MNKEQVLDGIFGVFSLLASSAPSLGYTRQKENSGILCVIPLVPRFLPSLPSSLHLSLFVFVLCVMSKSSSCTYQEDQGKYIPFLQKKNFFSCNLEIEINKEIQMLKI